MLPGMIYLDNNATTPLHPAVLEELGGDLRDLWANPSAMYRSGREAAKRLACARLAVAERLGVTPDEVVFTSGGTESNNAVIASAKQSWPARRRLVIGATEHPAVTEPARRWEEQGGWVTRVPVRRSGEIDVRALQGILDKGDTALVSIMWANNETGVIAPMEEIVDVVHAGGALLHTDAVQAAGKLRLDLRAVPVDFLSLSAHKFHGPKGIGALFASRRVRFEPLLLGGGQERGLRGGTENVPFAQALATALISACEAGHARVREMRDSFEQAVVGATGALVNGDGARRLDNTSSLTFPGLDAAGLLIMLDERGVSCSAGSACHAASVHPSPVLEAMGFDAGHAASTLRFSFSAFNTMEEARQAAEIVISVAARLADLTAGGPVLM